MIPLVLLSGIAVSSLEAASLEHIPSTFTDEHLPPVLNIVSNYHLYLSNTMCFGALHSNNFVNHLKVTFVSGN